MKLIICVAVFSGLSVLHGLNANIVSYSRCFECRGDQLIEAIDDLAEKRQCWFQPENHYLLQFKTETLNNIAEIMELLYTTSTKKALEKCRHFLELSCSVSHDFDYLSKCTVENVQRYAKAYNDLEQCTGKVNDPINLELLKKAIVAGIIMWNEIHPDC
ncbi:uncharacterized protein LOC142231171 [Haematobia irritans]|uniref:uncharacterized protein LOC142231171 n=1 Tax=Haematobia irritans TaxID=7368 RepID=UPI003F5085D8